MVPHFYQEAVSKVKGKLSFYLTCLQTGSVSQCSSFARAVLEEPSRKLSIHISWVPVPYLDRGPPAKKDQVRCRVL